ncbi:hypothetical protein BDZ85DRAFT_244545 [Elsinoe ampelina]|uniref:Myb-like domain-containing protein n=1 Tax=Elsinoe ampelina TaxID=302913 RepID=A0A6A6FZB7_9PEZI|nr:hypothetical protein BDZ85DRAFT_244545 [Elsinoe ampelina]
MDLQTSSAINKSGKIIAPKIAGRRRPAQRATPQQAPANPLPTPEPSQAPTEEDVVQSASETPARAEASEAGATQAPTTITPAPAESPVQDNQASNNTSQQEDTSVPQRTEQNEIEQDNEAVAGAEVLASLLQQARTESASSTTATQNSHAVAPIEPQSQSIVPTPRRQRKAPAPVAGTKRKRTSKTQLSAERIIDSDDEGETNVGTGQETTSGAQSAPKRAKARRKAAKAAATQADGGAEGTTGQAESAATPKPRARARKRKAAAQAADGDQVGNAEHAAEEEESDPELKEIDVNKTAMHDLVRLPTGGKTSKLERRMAEVDWDEVRLQRRLAAENPADPTNARDRAPAATPADPATAPTLRMVNGEIQYDEASSNIDRQAQAIRNAQNMAVAEDEDVTRQVNQASWINDKRRDPAERKPRMSGTPWNDDETDRFYDALRMFGTDFSIISKMFAPKTRKQIKLKLRREEKLDPQRVNAALGGTAWVQMDLKHYADVTGVEESEFRDPEIVNRELEETKKQQEVEVAAKKKEAEEAQKQRDIMEQQREKDKEGRDREKAVQKQQRELARRRKRAGRGQAVGTGTF